jgi:hypothetical protein
MLAAVVENLFEAGLLDLLKVAAGFAALLGNVGMPRFHTLLGGVQHGLGFFHVCPELVHSMFEGVHVKTPYLE